MAEELDRGNPLFNDEVQVQVKFPDHDKTLALTIRVLQGSRLAPAGSGGGQREGVLHIEITDELDSFFLFTLQVGEDDYHQLKHDQCLRVDFKSFPRKFIELLESCRGSSNDVLSAGIGGSRAGTLGRGVLDGRSSDVVDVGRSGASSASEPSFLARLETHLPGGLSVFSVVETNPFKELTHLSLKFRAGNDASIKGYLAARLGQLKVEVALMSGALEETRTKLEQEVAVRAQLEQEVTALRIDRERDARDLRAAHSAELTAAREESVRRAEDAAAARDEEMNALRRKAEADIAEISRRLRESEQRREELTDLKFAHEAELRDLRGRNEAGEAGREAAFSDAKALREANSSLETRAFEAEREAERLRLQGSALAQQLADAKKMVEKSQALQEASGASVARLEDTQEAYKGSVVALQERLEASVSEINRGNAIIQKLQGQYRALRTKAKLKSEVMKQQERLLAEHEASASAAESKLNAAAAERRAADARAESLRRELAAAEGRLEESARILSSNQQVIKWLNKELNDAQMGPGSTPATAAAALATGETATAFGGASAPPVGSSGGYAFGVAESPRQGFETEGGGGGAGSRGGKDVMFTAGLRESLAGAVRWDLRGTTLGEGDRNDAYFSYREVSARGVKEDATFTTPDHAARSNRYGRGGGETTSGHVVTPESGGPSDPAHPGSGRSPLRDKNTGGEGDAEHELEDTRGVAGGADRGIRAF